MTEVSVFGSGIALTDWNHREGECLEQTRAELY